MDEKKKVSDSQSEQVFMIRPQHVNSANRLFGGILMQWMDELAGIVAMRHCGSSVVTASVDTLNFKAGATIGNMVVLVGKVTHVGNTSLEVRVDAYIEDIEGMRRSINRAYFVMVALDEDGHPRKARGLELATESDRAEWQGGEKRHALRKQRRKEGY